MARPLGRVQFEVLRALVRHKYWYPHCGWLWGTPSGTQRILDSLVQRGLVVRDGNRYTPKSDKFYAERGL